MSRQLDISRTPIREALLVLQTEGLVELMPKRGAAVRSYGVDELDEIYQLRAVLEGYAARRAAERIDDAALADLRRSCKRFSRLCARKNPQVSDLVKENLLFHDRILSVTGSPRLTAMVHGVIQLPLVYKAYIWYSPEQKHLSERHHKALVDAMADHDGDRAEAIMKEHVYQARDHMIATARAEAGGDGSR